MDIHYELTSDAAYVSRCLAHPSIWPKSCDDVMSRTNPKFLYVSKGNNVWLRAGDYGVLTGEPRNAVWIEVHVALLPHANGIAHDICRGAISWMFSHTPFCRITASIPAINPLAASLAKRCGMTPMGINEKAFQKEGQLVDLLMFGISKE